MLSYFSFRFLFFFENIGERARTSAKPDKEKQRASVDIFGEKEVY